MILKWLCLYVCKDINSGIFQGSKTPGERSREDKRTQQSPSLDGNKHKVLRIIVWTEMPKIHIRISWLLNMPVREDHKENKNPLLTRQNATLWLFPREACRHPETNIPLLLQVGRKNVHISSLPPFNPKLAQLDHLPIPIIYCYYSPAVSLHEHSSRAWKKLYFRDVCLLENNSFQSYFGSSGNTTPCSAGDRKRSTC